MDEEIGRFRLDWQDGRQTTQPVLPWGSTSWTPDEDFGQLLEVNTSCCHGWSSQSHWFYVSPGLVGVQSRPGQSAPDILFASSTRTVCRCAKRFWREAAKRAVVIVTGKGDLRRQFEVTLLLQFLVFHADCTDSQERYAAMMLVPQVEGNISCCELLIRLGFLGISSMPYGCWPFGLTPGPVQFGLVEVDSLAQSHFRFFGHGMPH